MKIKLGIIAISILFLFIGTACASSKSDRKLKKQQWDATVGQLTKGASFTAGQRVYTVMPDLTLEPTTGNIAANQLTPESKRWMLGKQKIVKKSSQQALKTTPGQTVGTVVLSKSSGNFALMTGNITVTYSVGTDIVALAAKLSLSIVKDFPHLNTAYLKLSAKGDMQLALNEISLQPGVRKAEPEIIEHFMSAN